MSTVVTPPAGTRPPAGRTAVLIVAAALVALAVGLASGLLLGRASTATDLPASDSVEAGFARDMQEDHQQAVEMSVLVRESSQDEDVRRLALDIMLTQQQQAGQMFGWLETWGLPQARSGEPMGWMLDDMAGMEGMAGHSDDGGDAAADQAAPMTMPGVATDEQMAALDAAEGAEADRIYLALMIPHHEGGVEMADAALALTDQPQVVRLAEAVVASQTSELAVLDEMLTERGGRPDGL